MDDEITDEIVIKVIRAALTGRRKYRPKKRELADFVHGLEVKSKRDDACMNIWNGSPLEGEDKTHWARVKNGIPEEQP